MKIKKELKPLISSDKNIRNGIPVFKGTRVPVYIVIEHISLGWTLNDLKEAYPAVKTEDIMQVLRSYSKEFLGRHDTIK